MQILSHAIAEECVLVDTVADHILSHDIINALLWKAPKHLDPDTIQKMERGNPEKIAKCMALNKLMIQRIVALQPCESRQVLDERRGETHCYK